MTIGFRAPAREKDAYLLRILTNVALGVLIAHSSLSKRAALILRERQFFLLERPLRGGRGGAERSPPRPADTCRAPIPVRPTHNCKHADFLLMYSMGSWERGALQSVVSLDMYSAWIWRNLAGA